MFSLKGKVALLTGSAGGYGKHCVRALAEAGAKNFIASRNLSALQEVPDSYTSHGFDVTALQFDQGDEASRYIAGTNLLVDGDFLLMGKGMCMILYPPDAHMSSISTDKAVSVIKIVAKLPVQEKRINMSSNSVGTEQIQLSRLGLGTVQFGFDYGVNNARGQVPYDEVCAILTSASDQGVNFLDTSRSYGVSESVLGKAIAEIGRDFTICTKLDLPSNFSELSENEIGEAVNASFMGSCKSLQLNTLPMFLLHIFDYKTTHGGYVWSLLKEMKAKGLIGKLGVSIGRGPDEALKCLQDPDVEVMQIPFNVFDQRWKREGVLTQCREKGVELINRSTYLKGLLLMSVEKAAGLVPVSRERVKKMLEISEAVKVPVKELVFRYVLENPYIKTTIVGVDSIEQLEENIRLQNMGPLKSEIIHKIETAFLDSPDELLNPALWNTPHIPVLQAGQTKHLEELFGTVCRMFLKIDRKEIAVYVRGLMYDCLTDVSHLNSYRKLFKGVNKMIDLSRVLKQVQDGSLVPFSENLGTKPAVFRRVSCNTHYMGDTVFSRVAYVEETRPIIRLADTLMVISSDGGGIFLGPRVTL